MIGFDGFYIEPIQLTDSWNLCNFMVSNEDRFKRFFPQTLAQNLNPTLSSAFVEKKVKQFNSKEEFLFLIKEKESRAFAGLVFIKELDWQKKQGEFAYCIGYTYEGKGLTTKAVSALSQYAFKDLNLKTLQIITHKTNMGSVKIAEHCGFIRIKTLPKEFTPTIGAPLDMELYELYNER